MFISIIIFIITLLVLVLSHEFGHFVVAKIFKVKVLEFGFGIPPKICGKKFGETLVSLNWLPFGGFVRLFGEDETDRKILDDKRSFASKEVSQRIAIVTAGVLMNIALAAIIFWIVLASQNFEEKIPLLTPYQFFGVDQTNETVIIVGRVIQGSPAETANIQAGDQILKFGNIALHHTNDFIKLISEAGEEKIALTLKSAQNETKIVEVIPRKNPPEGQGSLGVEIGALTLAHLNYQSMGQKISSGLTHCYNLGSYSTVLIGQLIAKSFATQNLAPVSESISGPVGITSISAMILQTKNPFIPYLNFVGMLSLNLAIINILPFPALDGGRLFFLMIEAVFGKKVKPEIERFIHTFGMIMLLAFIILITFSDIKKLLF